MKHLSITGAVLPSVRPTTSATMIITYQSRHSVAWSTYQSLALSYRADAYESLTPVLRFPFLQWKSRIQLIHSSWQHHISLRLELRLVYFDCQGLCVRGSGGVWFTITLIDALSHRPVIQEVSHTLLLVQVAVCVCSTAVGARLSLILTAKSVNLLREKSIDQANSIVFYQCDRRTDWLWFALRSHLGRAWFLIKTPIFLRKNLSCGSFLWFRLSVELG